MFARRAHFCTWVFCLLAFASCDAYQSASEIYFKNKRKSWRRNDQTSQGRHVRQRAYWIHNGGVVGMIVRCLMILNKVQFDFHETHDPFRMIYNMSLVDSSQVLYDLIFVDSLFSRLVSRQRCDLIFSPGIRCCCSVGANHNNKIMREQATKPETWAMFSSSPSLVNYI